MGAGNYPVGVGPAGFDPASITAATAEIGARALLFDPSSHDILVDDQGHYLETHPVDSRVMINLGLEFGIVASANTIGSLLDSLPIDDAEPMTAEALRRVTLALADMIAAGDVALVLVNAWASPSSRAHIEIVYQNLRLPAADAAARQRTLQLEAI